jgi:PPK2 family polyphosphate:nucleotide phosphotransferase
MEKSQRKRIEAHVGPRRITDGRRFRLKDHPTGDTHGLADELKDESKEMLRTGVQMLAELQDKLYAQDRWSVLLVFQAMDAAGKDGTIKHVMSGINPQGCQVYSFKQPSAEELDHTWFWRYQNSLPERGRIGIFNRSYYEEVLVVRVHKAILDTQKMPARLVTKDIWAQRYRDIRAFEQHLADNGTLVLKFFLNVSRKEQKQRFMERLDTPEKNWKFSAADVRERSFWDHYMEAYQDAIRETAAPHAPWYVVPADAKWYTRLLVAAAIILEMDKLGLHYPEVGDKQRAELDEARRLLGAEGESKRAAKKRK